MAEEIKRKTRRPRANSKSGAVRAYMKRHPDAGPTAISLALKKRGIEITAAHVSNVKASMQKSGQAAGESAATNGEAPARNGRRGRPGRKPAPRDAVSLASLLDAQRFAERVGGLEKAIELISALSKLQG